MQKRLKTEFGWNDLKALILKHPQKNPNGVARALCIEVYERNDLPYHTFQRDSQQPRI